MCAMYYFPSWDLMQGEAWFDSCLFSISSSECGQLDFCQKDGQLSLGYVSTNILEMLI